MFHKLWILTKMQLSEKINLHSDKTTAQKIGGIAKIIVAAAISFGIMLLLFYLIFNLMAFKASENLFIFAIFLFQVLSIIACLLTMTENLYMSKDNSLLLTYPVKHIYVFISKLLVAYILELRRSIIFTAPLFLAYGIMVPGVISANYVIQCIVFCFLLPLFPVFLAAIISIPFVFITKIFNKATWVKGLFTLAVFAGLVVGTLAIIKVLPDQIRISALYRQFLENFDAFLKEANKYALYCNFVGKAIYEKDALTVFLNDVYSLASLIGLAAISIAISWPLFYRLASSASENSVQKTHKSKNVCHKSSFLTFMRKEMLMTLRNIGNFASDYIFLFIMPFVLLILAAILTRIDRNNLGVSLTYAAIGLTALVMLSASNTASATAISSEGNEFVLLKTAPGKTENIIWSKLLINLIISTFMLTLTFVLLHFTLQGHINISRLWIVYIYSVFVNLGLLLWSIQLDIMNPNLREYANSHNKADVKNSGKSILIGAIVSLLFSAVMVVLFLTNLSDLILGAILVGIALVFAIIRYYFLRQYTKAYFEDIQL